MCNKLSLCHRCPPRICPECPNSSLPSTLRDKHYPSYTVPVKFRELWEEWDATVMILYILFTQLYLHHLGRRRSHANRTRMIVSMNAWSLYLLSDLVAAITLGKLSKVATEEKPVSPMRDIWAPITFVYLGGPDTITVLALEENSMWIKHLIALLAQGARTSYVLYVSWTASWYSYLALVLLFCGVIKYGERVWLIRSRAQWKHGGFVQYNESKETTEHPNNILRSARRETSLVLRAFSNFRNLNSQIQVDEFKEQYSEWLKGPVSAGDVFKVIEIELGFMYNMLFTKIGTLFTVWGFVLRFISVSCLVCVLVVVFMLKKPPRLIDFPISVVLLVGAIFLEVAGVLVQLVSDRAVVWANKYQQVMLMKPIFCLQEQLLSKRKRWAGSMGQFDFVKFYSKPTHACCGELLSTSMDARSNLNKVPLGLKELIIRHFRETLLSGAETELAFTSSRGKRTLTKYRLSEKLKPITELEFDESVIIWHLVTEIIYHREDSKSVQDEMTMTTTLSNYLMYLLHTCPSTFSSCRISREFKDTISAVRDILAEGKGSVSSTTSARKQLLEKILDHPNGTNLIGKIVQSLMEDEIGENKWDILSNVWVEMLCYAASGYPAEKHVQNLRQGGEFLTHVWLLLVHLGDVKLLEVDVSIKLRDIAESAHREMNLFKTGAAQDSSTLSGIV